MADLRRSPSLESVSSVQSLASMQSAESINSLVSTGSLDEGGAKTSDHENLNDIDMGRTITSIPILPPSASENGQGVDEPSSKIGDWANTCHDGLEPSSATCPSSGPAVKPALLNTKKHNRFYMDPRTIQLVLDDGTLYRVFRQLFEEHSSAFATQYLADCSEGKPIKLSGVSSVDLDRFLSLMYPSELATCELSTADEWTSVLRLAHKWSFAALRTRAIREIKLVGTAVDRIASAREFSDLDELQEWLLPAFTETCTASDWLQTTTVDDAERLGAGTLLHIARIREDARQRTKKSSACAMERAIVAAGLAPAPMETCVEPPAPPTYDTLAEPPASEPLEIPSSPSIAPKPTTTLDAQGSRSASPPSAPVDTAGVNTAAPTALVVPAMTVEQAPTRPQKANDSNAVAAAPRPASPAVGDKAEPPEPPVLVPPCPVVNVDPPRAPSATQSRRNVPSELEKESTPVSPEKDTPRRPMAPQKAPIRSWSQLVKKHQPRSALTSTGPTSATAGSETKANTADGEHKIDSATTPAPNPPAPAMARAKPTPEAATASAEEMARMREGEEAKMEEEGKGKCRRLREQVDRREEEKLEARVEAGWKREQGTRKNNANMLR